MNTRPASEQHIVSQRLLMTFASLSIMAILSIVGFFIHHDYIDDKKQATRSASNIVQLVDRNISEVMRLYDDVLNGMIKTWQSAPLNSLPEDIQHQLLFSRAQDAPSDDGFFILNAHGVVVADSRTAIASPADLSDQAYFTAHRHGSRDALFISPPFKTGPDVDDWNIAFSRRISAPDGTFLGVGVAQMRLEYFYELFQSLELSPDDTINLMSSDGTLITQYPVTIRPLFGTYVGCLPGIQRLFDETEGSFIATSHIYGVERLYSFSRVRNLPLVVVVALSTDSIFEGWRMTTWVVGSFAALLCLSLIWMTWMLNREMRLRQHVETELEGLATTDPLTTLANRRTLDARLAHEWRRAQRADRCISLIMMDIDHFKAFNDTYGHQAGDDVIRKVAQQIKSQVRRPSDLAARYGGEEFAVLLVDTDTRGARQIAEGIRKAVEGMAPITDGGTSVTISLGTYTRQVRTGDTLQELVRKADAALYEAKHSGRNRVVSVSEQQHEQNVA